MVLLWSIVAANVGPTGLGEVQLIYLLAIIVGLIVSLGLPVSNAYLIGKARHPASAVLGLNLICLAIGSFIGSSLLFAGRNVLNHELPIAPELFGLLLIWIPLQICGTNFSSILLAQQRFKEQALVNTFQGIVSLVLVVSAVEVVGLHLKGITIALIFATVFGCGYQVVLLHNELRDRLIPALPLVKECIIFSLKGYVASILQFFTYRFDVFIVGHFLGAGALGCYAVAYTATEFLWYIPQAIATVLMPTTANSNASDANQRTLRLCRISIIGSILGGLMLGIAAAWAIPFFLGAQFKSSVILIWILLPGVITFVLSKIIAADLIGRGYPEYASYVSTGGLSATALLDILFIPKYGLPSAAVISSIVYASQSAYLVMCFCRVSRLSLREVVVPRKEDFDFAIRASTALIHQTLHTLRSIPAATATEQN